MPQFGRSARLLLMGRADAKGQFHRLLDAAAEHTPPCSNDPDLWWSDDRLEQAQAQNFCFGCPLLEPCYQYAIAGGEQWGTWGGTTAAERTILMTHLKQSQRRQA